MLKTKVFEWIGFIIVLASIVANASIRASGNTNGTWINITMFGMIMGAIIAFIFFFIRIFGSKKHINNSTN